MRCLQPFLILVVTASALRSSHAAVDGAPAPEPAPVNAAIGDTSFVATFGRPPDRNDDNTLRIRTHLTFVEHYLRTHEPTALHPAQRARRHAALDALAHYTARGIFPRRTSDTYGKRRPRFIDDLGTHCAVGHLIADSGAPELARTINARFEYAYVPDIDTPALHAWADRTGFTIDELAMIQPSYPKQPTISDTHNFVTAAMEAAALECARTIAMPTKLTLKITGLRHKFEYYPEVETPRDSFGACVANKLAEWPVRGHVLAGPNNPKLTFPFSITASLGTPHDLFQRSFTALAAGGIFSTTDERELWKLDAKTLATIVTINATSDNTGTTVSITSTPPDATVDQAFKAMFELQLQSFGAGTWNIKLHDKRTVAAWRNLRKLGFGIEDALANADTPCMQPASGESSPNVTAKVNAAGVLSVSSDARDKALRRCITKLLTAKFATTAFDAGGATTHRRRFPVDPRPSASAAEDD